MNNILKSIWACFAGILVGVILSIGTDKILESMGILPHDNLWVSSSIIIFVIFYRTIYNIIGSYIVARLAPSLPMRHVMVVGVLGTIATIFGAIATRNMNLGPEWYCWALIVLALPSAWVGGKLFLRKN